MSNYTPKKAINIRDYNDSALDRQTMGYFKYTAYRMGIKQAELLTLMLKRSLEQINKDYDFKQGNCIEFKLGDK